MAGVLPCQQWEWPASPYHHGRVPHLAAPHLCMRRACWHPSSFEATCCLRPCCQHDEAQVHRIQIDYERKSWLSTTENRWLWWSCGGIKDMTWSRGAWIAIAGSKRFRNYITQVSGEIEDLLLERIPIPERIRKPAETCASLSGAPSCSGLASLCAPQTRQPAATQFQHRGWNRQATQPQIITDPIHWAGEQFRSLETWGLHGAGCRLIVADLSCRKKRNCEITVKMSRDWLLRLLHVFLFPVCMLSF